MNPSASDWILKYLNLFKKEELIGIFKNEHSFYESLKQTGFLYGVSVTTMTNKSLGSLELTTEELTKVNLFHALLFQFFQNQPEANFNEAITDILAFYRDIERGKTGFFYKFSIVQSPSNALEHILAARLNGPNSLFKKNTVSQLTYSLLFLDLLVYKQWQKDPNSAKTYYAQKEKNVLTACFYTLKSKRNKTKYDHLLIELFESSATYLIDETEAGAATFLESLNYLDPESFSLEKNYMLDLCCLVVWEDLLLDDSEHQFLQQLLVTLNFTLDELPKHLDALKTFAENHTKEVLHLEYSNPMQQFYKQSSATVKLLIIRNKHRLTQELEESSELILLLRQSTMRELKPEEKVKVREQLLDICKTIPSLTIFLLPGGTVLLPLLVKFIPKLLPSSFQDNRIN
ncbi:LETM1-related biofilm-associated protein [Aequorivita marina]|uniref:LETM1-related biofilm-associated protein n=1 Tax=Aequorivita marina TaxID=3073654 RepID=UPI002874B9E9|nr:LETM1-related biofilm-associated protein [Aequorivita sp. S2608]MDS1299639.1 LETM1-related biofilm-associated protein [Aequorivita sp. S2608]